MPSYERLLANEIDPPHERFAPRQLGEPTELAAELGTVSRLWFACGYRPGIAAYLAFFLLGDLIELHDRAVPRRFASFRAMAASFYRTDLFVRDVTDSGAEPSGGISSPRVRAVLAAIMARHRRVRIPPWSMTWFGWVLLEAVEAQCAPLDAEQQRLHLAYMAKAYRLMGIPFGPRRDVMQDFARDVERVHARVTPQLERHARRILRLGEMVGVPGRHERIAALLPPAPRTLFDTIAARVCPSWPLRAVCRGLGRVLMPRAVGVPRAAVPLSLAVDRPA